jgi:competence protein ComFC
MLGRTLRSAQTSVFLCTTLLLKVKETRAQSKKHRKERLLSIHNAFKINVPVVKEMERLAPDLIIIVDDVYTTGATITEIWETLQHAAAKNILSNAACLSFSFAQSLR